MKTERRSSEMDFPENRIAAVERKRFVGQGSLLP